MTLRSTARTQSRGGGPSTSRSGTRARPEPVRAVDNAIPRALHALLHVERPNLQRVRVHRAPHAVQSVSPVLVRPSGAGKACEVVQSKHSMPVNADPGLHRHSQTLAHGRLELPALATPSKKIHAAKRRVALLLLVRVTACLLVVWSLATEKGVRCMLINYQLYRYVTR